MMGGRVRPRLPQPQSPNEAAITVAYKDMTLADALKDFCAKTGYLVDAAKDQRDKKVTLSATGKPFEVLRDLCMQVQCAPRTVIFLEPEAKMPKSQPKFDLPQLKVTVGMQDTDTKIVLEMISTAAKIGIIPDADVAKATPQITVNFDKASVEEVIDKLTKQLKCHAARGMRLEHFDPRAAMEKFMKLPPAQQEKLMLQGINAMQGHMPNQQQVQQGMATGLKKFWQMSPDQQQQVVQRVSQRLTAMGDMISQFSPEGQAKVMRVVEPFLKSGLAVYLRMTPAQQRTFAPAIKALEHFPGGAPH